MQWCQESLAPDRGRRDSRIPDQNGPYAPRDFSPPQLGSSTPSSFRRIRKTKSAFVISQIFHPPEQEVPGVVYAAERSPQKNENARKSMSFLRGGTEFMGEGKSRERRSYYMESSARKGCPAIIFPEISERYKGMNEKGEWGAMRYSVKKKARKLSESLFGSMRKVLGKSCGDDKTSIPEQHISSRRMHFRDYVTPEEELNYSAPGRFGVKDKPKIRSNYVVSKEPTLHLVSSYEMIRSDVGSILEASPCRETKERKFSAASARTSSTATSGHWNSTIASRMTGQNLRESMVDRSGMNAVIDKDDEGYFQPPPRRERYNVDARRVYSALLKRINSEENDTPKEPTYTPAGYYMTPGIGLLPEEEGIFERKPAATIRKRTNQKNETAEVPTTPDPYEPYEYELESPPPPVPKIPEIWFENEVAKAFDGARRHREGTGNMRFESDGTKSRLGNYADSTLSTAQKPITVSKRSSYSDMPRTSTGFRTPGEFSVSTDAALSACHLQMLKRRSAPGTYANNENLRRARLPSSFPSNENLRKRPIAYTSNENPHKPPTSYVSNENIRRQPTSYVSSENLRRPTNISKRLSNLENSGSVVRRSRSLLDHSNTRTPVERPLSRNFVPRSGLRNVDSNCSRTEEPLHHILARPESRISLSGRVSRLSMKDFDVGLAVARQFGPVIGAEEEVRGGKNWDDGNYGYGIGW